MRDAIGGSVTLVIIVVFIVFALGYMAFNINYTKAFRMKDKIVTLYDDYDGDCKGNSKCQTEIRNYANQIGYSNGAGTGGYMSCPSGYDPEDNLYCIHENPITSSDGTKKIYYSIATRIGMDVPAFRNALNFNFFYIFGDTKTYKK